MKNIVSKTISRDNNLITLTSYGSKTMIIGVSTGSRRKDYAKLLFQSTVFSYSPVMVPVRSAVPAAVVKARIDGATVPFDVSEKVTPIVPLSIG